MIGQVAKKGVLSAIAVLAMSVQASAQNGTFAWPDNPFALTLSDDLFLPTDELRFEKATRVFVDSMSGIGDEVLQIATYPVRDPWSFGAFALGIGGLVLIDRPTTTIYQKTILPIGEKFDLPRPFEIPHISTDEQYVAGAILGSYAWGFAANDERAQVAALLATKAVVYSYVTSHVLLKAGFGRLRPVTDLEGHTGPTGAFTTSPFDFFQGTGVHLDSDPLGTALPSFHFTLYFSTARIYSGVYDNYLIPYGVAAALALNSAEGHNHWVSDMVAGALIGTGIGNVILNGYENRRNESFGVVMPVVSSKGVGLNYSLNF
jgi:hypothetical protein